ncbi:hypothetical protein [Leptospira sp. GIMC2001]|uniref:hypothetical protein n=1 Tax=Leptospira sp. GIMC2001 TaxID=1513297 RepID=UPI002349E4A6|nr:hypothetical protein [Leptospira sp. GIMC2001]WCL48545.1 hypothetical protein O4O04_14720 [Leptospira sp. GIMC2001]
MLYIRLILLFILSSVLVFAFDSPKKFENKYLIEASPAAIHKAISGNFFPRMASGKVGNSAEVVWEGEASIIEVTNWEIPFKFGYERKNSSRFSKYAGFYEIKDMGDGKSMLEVQIHWEPVAGIQSKIWNRLFYLPETKKSIENDIEIIRKAVAK